MLNNKENYCLCPLTYEHSTLVPFIWAFPPSYSCPVCFGQILYSHPSGKSTLNALEHHHSWNWVLQVVGLSHSLFKKKKVLNLLCVVWCGLTREVKIYLLCGMETSRITLLGWYLTLMVWCLSMHPKLLNAFFGFNSLHVSLMVCFLMHPMGCSKLVL